MTFNISKLFEISLSISFVFVLYYSFSKFFRLCPRYNKFASFLKKILFHSTPWFCRWFVVKQKLSKNQFKWTIKAILKLYERCITFRLLLSMKKILFVIFKITPGLWTSDRNIGGFYKLSSQFYLFSTIGFTILHVFLFPLFLFVPAVFVFIVPHLIYDFIGTSFHFLSSLHLYYV